MTKIELTNSLRRGGPSIDFGTVWRYNDHIYRTIEKKYINQVRTLVSNTEQMERLHEKGLIETTIAPVHTEEYDFLLEHKLVEFESHSNEWCLSAKIDASYMVLELLEELVRHGWFLWDGVPFNVLFDYTEPRWTDFHSIVPFTVQTCWEAEFNYHFFKGVGGDVTLWDREWKSIKDTHTALAFLEKIKEALLTIPINPKKTPWFDYPRLSDTDLDDKQKSTLQIIEKVKPNCETFLDIGCNVGWYSRAAHGMGYRVVAIDVDEACIAELYAHAKETESKILPLVSDFRTCLDIINQTHPSFVNRIQCDVTLSLALLHHLVFFQHLDFPFIAERLDALTKKIAIVQFITREDGYVKHWLKTADRNYDWYTMDNFISSMTKYFPKHEVFESSPVGRKLIVFEKKL
jgi:SAM-dependent methyltransferase